MAFSRECIFPERERERESQEKEFLKEQLEFLRGQLESGFKREGRSVSWVFNLGLFDTSQWLS